MSYTIVILRRAQRELAVLPQEAYIRVRDAIKKLGEEPRLPGCAKCNRSPGSVWMGLVRAQR